MLAFLKLIGGWRAAVFLAAALALGGWGVTERLGRLSAENNLAAVHSLQEITARKYAELQLQRERELAAAFAKATKNHLEEQRNAKQKYDATLAALRTDNLRLRQRFTCPAPGDVHSTPASGSDGGEGSGLLREDAEFLISEAQRADDIVRQLKLAQETIRIMLEAHKND